MLKECVSLSLLKMSLKPLPYMKSDAFLTLRCLVLTLSAVFIVYGFVTNLDTLRGDTFALYILRRFRGGLFRITTARMYLFSHCGSQCWHHIFLFENVSAYPLCSFYHSM